MSRKKKVISHEATQFAARMCIHSKREDGDYNVCVNWTGIGSPEKDWIEDCQESIPCKYLRERRNNDNNVN